VDGGQRARHQKGGTSNLAGRVPALVLQTAAHNVGRKSKASVQGHGGSVAGVEAATVPYAPGNGHGRCLQQEEAVVEARARVSGPAVGWRKGGFEAVGSNLEVVVGEVGSCSGVLGYVQSRDDAGRDTGAGDLYEMVVGKETCSVASEMAGAAAEGRREAYPEYATPVGPSDPLGYARTVHQ